MNTQDIKTNMTQDSEWFVNQLNEVKSKTRLIATVENAYYHVKVANAHAICNAVNATYGNNINPDKVKEMYDQLNQIKMDLTEMQNSCMSRSVLDYVGIRLPILETLLTSAKLS